MKRLLFGIMAVALLIVGNVANAQDTRIQLGDLPVAAQDFIKTHFAGQTPDYIIKDTETFSFDYTVKFQNGTEIEFDGKGQWTEIEGQNLSLTMLPKAIPVYLKANYPSASVVKIDKDRGFEIKLSNGLELKFDNKGRFVSLDD